MHIDLIKETNLRPNQPIVTFSSNRLSPRHPCQTWASVLFPTSELWEPTANSPKGHLDPVWACWCGAAGTHNLYAYAAPQRFHLSNIYTTTKNENENQSSSAFAISGTVSTSLSLDSRVPSAIETSWQGFFLQIHVDLKIEILETNLVFGNKVVQPSNRRISDFINSPGRSRRKRAAALKLWINDSMKHKD